MRKNYKKIRNNIPTEIRIGPKKIFKIIWTDDLPPSKNNKPTYGLTKFDTREIIINKNLNDYQAVHTFWHEVLHTFKLYKKGHLPEKQVLFFEKRFDIISELFLTLYKDKLK